MLSIFFLVGFFILALFPFASRTVRIQISRIFGYKYYHTKDSFECGDMVQFSDPVDGGFSYYPIDGINLTYKTFSTTRDTEVHHFKHWKWYSSCQSWHSIKYQVEAHERKLELLNKRGWKSC